jgi:alpha-1,2-mannosyltransferase
MEIPADIPSAKSASGGSRGLDPRTVMWLKFIVGAVVIVLWGLFFDDLVRVGRWLLDAGDLAKRNLPVEDLQARYRDAHTVLSHGNLYGIHWETTTYPPITSYLFVPFRLIGLRATETLWTVANLVALAVLFTVALHRWFKVALIDAWFGSALGLAPAVIFAFYPFRSLLLWGQVGVFLMLLVFLDLFALPKRFRGILIGVAAAIKLLPALFIIWFLVKREVPAVVRAIAAFAVLTLFAAVLWPHASAEYWFHVLPSVRVGRIVTVARAHWVKGAGKLSNQSIKGLLARPPFLFLKTFPWFPIALLVLAWGLAVTVRLLKQGRELATFVLLSLVTELVSPVSWLHYWVFVGLAPLLALYEWRRDRPLAVASIVLALSTCANLDNNILITHPFTTMAPLVLFIVRNLYVLGGLVFLGIATWRAFRLPAVELDARKEQTGERQEIVAPAPTEGSFSH